MNRTALFALPGLAVLAGCATLLGADFDRAPAQGDAGGPGVTSQNDGGDCASICVSPPANACLDAKTLRAYPPQGSCAGNGCTYLDYIVQCTNSCENGACTGVEPCNNVTCVTQQPAVCTDSSTLTSYSASGVCSGGHCSYPPNTTTCTAAPSNANPTCLDGACDFACSHGFTRAGNSCAANGDGGASGWTAQVPGTSTGRFFGVWASGPGDIFAVGTLYEGGGSVVLHSTGQGTWTAQSPPTDEVLFGVWGSSPTNVYAVGWSGTILHSSDGRTWSVQGAGVTSFNLSGVWGRDESHVFAVGANSENTAGQILSSAGDGSWTVQQNVNTSLNAIWGSGGDIYAVATNGVYHSTGDGTWTFKGTGTGSLSAISGTSSTNFYVVGDNGNAAPPLILHFSGSATFATETAPGGIWPLHGVWGSSASDVYAVGDVGKIYHSTDGKSWLDETSVNAALKFNAIGGTGSDDIYVVGDDDVIRHGP